MLKFASNRKLIFAIAVFFISSLYLLPGHNVYAKEKYTVPEIVSIEVFENSIGKYEKFEVDVDLNASYTNPYDSQDINLSALFISPSGMKLLVPGFLYSGVVDGNKISDAVWKVRFSPDEVGEWEYIVIVKNRYGEKKSKIKKFKCVSSSNKGNIRVSKSNPRYFEFDNGEFYYPVGHNVCWASPVEYRYNRYFKDMQTNGENWSRVWMCSWGVALEWKDGKSLYEGLGKYNLRNAKRLDKIIELADKYGIYIQLVINNHGQLSKEINAEWKDNPYNAKNGGPCKKPEDFFINQKAKRLFKNRLRYIIARWGYAPNILAWELFNEVDLTNKYKETKVCDWHKEMAEFVKKADPFGHLVTTSFGRKVGYKIWELSLIDFTQVHSYSTNLVEEIDYWVNDLAGKFNKPTFGAECGNDSQRGTIERREDPKGIHLHNAIWSSLISPSAGTAMYWWWDTYIKDNYLYHHFKILSNFMLGEDLRNLNLEKSKFQIEYISGDLAELELTPFLDWRTSTFDEFIVTNEGIISNIEGFSRYIQGEFHQKMRISPVFYVDYPKGGNFTINVNGVSKAGAKIAIYVDGSLKLEDTLSFLGERENIIRPYTVEIPAGKHRIKVINNGADWFRIRNIILSGYISPLRAKGVQDGKYGFFWFQNRANRVENFKRGIELLPILGAKVTLKGFLDGDYIVEYWDTYKGEIIKKEIIQSNNGRFVLMLPSFTKDIACKIKPFSIEKD